MKRLLMVGASLLACAMLLSSAANAQSIECAAEVPKPAKGHWYYRLIDGRKCWYEGKPMMPKSSLHWPKEKPVVEAEVATPAPVAASAPEIRPSTDGRSVSDVSASPSPDPNIWPAPVKALDDTSFESRWQALKPRN
jgi:hypothetical protein